MKKFLILLILFFSSNLLFSLDAKYFQNNKKIDHLYVNASDGLRIRERPDLSSTKIGILYDRMAVKVIAVGNEVIIDGIKSNWVKILLPVQTLRSGYNEYGWVFGGYLTDKIKKFSTDGWKDSDLKNYLSRFAWTSGKRGYYEYNADGSYKYGLLESGAGAYGTYFASMKTKSITEKVKVGDEDYESELRTFVYNIVKIEEYKLIIRNEEGAEIILRPAITNSYFYPTLAWENFENTSDFGISSYNALMYASSSDLIKEIYDENYFPKVKSNLIKMGIYMDDEDYKKDYNKYWN